jgi:hypothetical protein
MNNGLTAEGRRRRAQRAALFGKPKGAAQLVHASANRSEWRYRGFRMIGRRRGGWNGGWEWIAEGPGLQAPGKRVLMARIDANWDGRSAPNFPEARP